MKVKRPAFLIVKYRSFYIFVYIFLLFSMQALSNDARYCTKPEIIASRLTSIRNIYLRQELYTISSQIQEKYKERLPALHLVSIAAYEQVFNRQVTYQIF